MDCCDSTDDGRRFYVELKTSREVCLPVGISLPLHSFLFFNFIPYFCYLQLEYHTEEKYEREKLLKFWVIDNGNTSFILFSRFFHASYTYSYLCVL